MRAAAPAAALARLAEHDDAIGVGTEPVVIDTPDIRGLGEILPIDQHSLARKARRNAQRNDSFLEPDFSVANFADFECDLAAAFRDAIELSEYTSHLCAPCFDSGRHRNTRCDGNGVERVEPAAQPVVLRVLHDIEKRR